MFYYADSQLDNWILDDISSGDLTTRSLGIGGLRGSMEFSAKQDIRISGLDAARAILRKLDLKVESSLDDGIDVRAGAFLLRARGRADKLHLGWKVAQNILEWCSGVATYTARMIELGRHENPGLHLACTRKSIPGTKPLATAAVIHGGGIMHRGGTSETVLLFSNHRSFVREPDNWAALVQRLRREVPEKKIVVEVDTMEEAYKALEAKPDVLQLDKFKPDDVRSIVLAAAAKSPPYMISAAGGVHIDNIAEYAATGVDLVVSSAPYYARPADVKVVMTPQ